MKTKSSNLTESKFDIILEYEPTEDSEDRLLKVFEFLLEDTENKNNS